MSKLQRQVAECLELGFTDQETAYLLDVQLLHVEQITETAIFRIEFHLKKQRSLTPAIAQEVLDILYRYSKETFTAFQLDWMKAMASTAERARAVISALLHALKCGKCPYVWVASEVMPPVRQRQNNPGREMIGFNETQQRAAKARRYFERHGVILRKQIWQHG